MPLSLDDFDYALPADLIAQHPPVERSASRLLRVATDGLHDEQIGQLPAQVRPGDLLVFNDTRVIPARLRGRRATGGAVEVLIERILDAGEALAHVRASHSPGPGARMTLAEAIEVEVLGREDDLFRLRLVAGDDPASAPPDWLDALTRHGSIPLPPYITHAASDEDASRYQTVYARDPGAVAAPTAGLHFDTALLRRLEAAGARLAWVTLHVGAGTFQPVRVQDIATHRMHAERYTVSAATRAAVQATRAAGGRVWAIGTTSLRALEAAAAEHDAFAPPSAGAAEATGGQDVGGDTRLFITPGYRFRVVDRLLTNFHLPKSTLLMLVSAFAGMDTIRDAYAHAVTGRYRFFSYGDAMLLDRRDPHPEPAQ
jgi:S-adenosylmethionine:tRNA ribosyltransferase-isomerase